MNNSLATGTGITAIRHLRESPKKTATSKTDCADVLHQAIEAQLQQRIDQDLAFYFEVNFDDHPNLNTSPFLFFKGEVFVNSILAC